MQVVKILIISNFLPWGSMSPKQHKKLHFGFGYVILAPIVFDQEAEVEAVVDTMQLWILEAVSPKSSVTTL